MCFCWHVKYFALTILEKLQNRSPLKKYGTSLLSRLYDSSVRTEQERQSASGAGFQQEAFLLVNLSSPFCSCMDLKFSAEGISCSAISQKRPNWYLKHLTKAPQTRPVIKTICFVVHLHFELKGFKKMFYTTTYFSINAFWLLRIYYLRGNK